MDDLTLNGRVDDIEILPESSEDKNQKKSVYMPKRKGGKRLRNFNDVDIRKVLAKSPLQWSLSSVVTDPYRFKVVVAGRRCGKTSASLRWLIRRCIECPDPAWENWFVAPTMQLARDIAFGIFSILFRMK
jgi:hypothetical protein